MFQGHTLHTNQLIHLGRNVLGADHRLAIDELPIKPTILVGKRHFSCNANLSMTMFFLFQNFEAEFSTTLQQFDQASGFLIRFGDYTTAVVKHEHHFHLFDSHASNANGFPDPTGKAVAIYFPNSL